MPFITLLVTLDKPLSLRPELRIRNAAKTRCKNATSIQSESLQRRSVATCLCATQAVFQSDIGGLMEQVGAGKESLSFMKRRMRRLASQWAAAARRLDDKLRGQWRGQKKVSRRPCGPAGAETQQAGACDAGSPHFHRQIPWR